MFLALLLSWASMLAHNLFELPLTPLDLENSGPLVVDVILALAFALRPGLHNVMLGILAWGLLNLLIGGVVSVLPLAVLPFVPEQSPSHYLVHVVYALGQVPLVLLSLRALRGRPASVAEHGA
jgi:thiamine transporter ThiT